MKLFGMYLRQRIRGIGAVLLVILLFAATLLLERLPLKAVWYPALLSILLSGMFLLADFAKVRKKHRQLSQMKKMNASMLTSFPESKSIEEQDYQEIIRALQAEMRDFENASENRYQNMMDYYTVWAHQIKTPIASMKLHLQNEDTPLSRKLSFDLFRIEQYAEMVLAYLRLDSETGDYIFKKHAVDAIVRQSVKKFASEFITRKIQLEYQPSDETVLTDDKWLSFVLEQVISNALKYTKEGGRIKIYMNESKALCVEDTGIGIAPEDLPRIFEKGYTGYNGHQDKRASGIGLYLCKRICRNLGSEITVQSEPDKGTSVFIHLKEYDFKAE